MPYMYRERGVERTCTGFSKHIYQLSVHPATNALTQNATLHLLKLLQP